MKRVLLWALATILGAAVPAAAQFPIFDAHIHYSRPDWDTYTPERALSILAAAGVRRAIVSSTPDDGTLKLHEKAPKTVVFGPLPKTSTGKIQKFVLREQARQLGDPPAR